MENKQSLKHTQLPNHMAEDGLTPRDQLIYVVIKSKNNPQNECYPSLSTISKISGYSVPTIRKSINLLIEKGYITTKLVGRKYYYYFNNYKTFEPFSDEFLAHSDITPSTKAYIVAAQQHMFKDIENIGKISYSMREQADLMNTSSTSIHKACKELEHLGYMDTIKNKSIDPETKCKTDTKIIYMDKLDQQIIWEVKKLRKDVDQNTEDIQTIKNQLAEYKKLLDALSKEKEIPQYIL